MNLVLKALQFAMKKHDGQVRRGTGDAYVSHPLAVSYLVAGYKTSKKIDEILAASLLHDTLEDTETTFLELATEFTPLVAGLVVELTNDEFQLSKMGKLEYQKKKLCGISSYGLVIKLADRLHNVSDNPTKKMLEDTLVLVKYVSANRKLSKTQKQIIEDIVSTCKSKIE